MAVTEFIQRYQHFDRRISKLYAMYGDGATESIRRALFRIHADFAAVIRENQENGVDDSNVYQALEAADLPVPIKPNERCGYRF